MTAAPRSASIFVLGALFRSIPTAFHPRAAFETRGDPTTRTESDATLGERERERELELGGYLLEDLVKVHPRSRVSGLWIRESCHTRVI